MFLLYLGLFLISTFFAADEEINYCDINKQHALCGAEKDLIDEKSGIIHFAPKSDTERKNFLKRINSFRNDLAENGMKLGKTFLPQAENMLELEWDLVCENAAKNLIRNCGAKTYRPCCNCMNTGKMDIFSTISNISFPGVKNYPADLLGAFNRFYETNKNNLTTFPSTCQKNISYGCFEHASGFYASLFNARQVKIGCSYVVCSKRKGNESETCGYLLCVTNLDLYLDVIGKPLYSYGKPGSKCPKPYTLRSENYDSLCRCNNTDRCLIKPAKLSPKCTKRNGTLTTHPPTKHLPRTTAPAIAQTAVQAPPPQGLENDNPPVPYDNEKKRKEKKKSNSKTAKKISGLGGGGDTSGVKGLEDGDDFAFMFMMIWFLFIF